MAFWDGIDFGLGIAAVTALAAGPAYLCARWRAARQPADQRLTELLETLPSAVAVFDPADRLVQANDQLLRLLTDLRATIRSGQSRREVFTQLAEAGVFAEAIGRVESFVDDIMWLSTNGDSDWEANLTDGRCLHFRERVGSNGQRLVTCLDITTQKRQSWELEEKSTMLRTTLDSIDQGLLVFGPDFRLVNWNDQFFKLNGIDPAIAAVGLSLHDLITHFAEKGLLDANPGGEAVDERVRSVMRCEPPQLNARLPSGRVLDLRRRPMPAGGVAITCTDITDLENREEALKRRSAELEAIFGNMDEGLAVIEKNLDIVAMNERHLELLELSPQEAETYLNMEKMIRHLAERGEYGPGDAVELANGILAKGFVNTPSSYWRERPDGTVLEVRTYPMPDGRVLVITRDITVERANERALRASKEQAELANRAKSDFLANTSHELRTPLNAIIGFADILSGEMFGPLGSPHYVEYARDIHESGQHLLAIINDLLDLAKIESGHLELMEEQLSLTNIINVVLRLTRERAREGDLKVVADLDPETDGMTGDERALKQIVLNLVSNAVKFTPAGGSITVGNRLGDDGRVELSVTDTGIGMAEDDIPKALTPFTQLEGSMVRQYDGTGLGLPLARHLCELHDGELSIRSSPGEGTTATIHLPAYRLIAPMDDFVQVEDDALMVGSVAGKVG